MSATTIIAYAGSDLVGTTYTHRFHPPSAASPRPSVFLSNHVTSDSGTGLVHSAPAHGYEDYESFAAAGILPANLRCPIDDDGRFTDELVAWADDDVSVLVGKPVLGDGIDAMISLLRQDGTLLAEELISHRYPCDWKTKEPIIIRATPQWFADVEAVKQPAMESLDRVNFIPPQCKSHVLAPLTPARNRLEAFVQSRSEWCISRQRSWGVPIPALFDEAGKPLLNTSSLSHIISVLESKGTDHWWTGPVSDFAPNGAFTKGTDTLDVWFDSGSSWTLLNRVADVYLEGSDQHRGWFQSSLLTHLTAASTAPYKNLITHGFIMDENGQKMSKSAGNGLSPMEVVNGTEVSKRACPTNVRRPPGTAPTRCAFGRPRSTTPAT